MWIVDPDTQQEVEVPAHATVERALARRRLLHAGELVEMRVMPEWSVRLPLWWDEEVLPGDELELLLGPDLMDALADWNAEWERNVMRSDWTQRNEAWRWRGHALVEALQEALYLRAVVRPAGWA